MAKRPGHACMGMHARTRVHQYRHTRTRTQVHVPATHVHAHTCRWPIRTHVACGITRHAAFVLAPLVFAHVWQSKRHAYTNVYALHMSVGPWAIPHVYRAVGNTTCLQDRGLYHMSTGPWAIPHVYRAVGYTTCLQGRGLYHMSIGPWAIPHVRLHRFVFGSQANTAVKGIGTNLIRTAWRIRSSRELHKVMPHGAAYC